MNKYVCIHGHFYQPPRENPWLEEVEVEDSASPYHDWNERITRESYAANTASRILNDKKMIVRLKNNYENISFNFGPTLLSWMEKHNIQTYSKIIEADKISVATHNGHGNAIAQVYNHIIMPLASLEDKITQVKWGIYEFKHRFGRLPEGMWLAETAVDKETLKVLAAEGIKFTILSPNQAKKVRKIGTEKWENVEDGKIDITKPYICKIDDESSITIFFYHSSISHAIAFEGLLNSGDKFYERITDVFKKSSEPQLVNIATDGESYGHHHHFGEMALAYCLEKFEKSSDVKLTNYGEYLSLNPPGYEVEIIENTAWSCYHGVGRWMDDCGCNVSNNPNWNQKWRKPLRENLNWLRDEIDNIFMSYGTKYFNNPWETRNRYIEVILNRDEKNVKTFLQKECIRELDFFERVEVMSLLEMERNRLLMFTSCGWYFDEPSGIETTQILKYASRAIQLTKVFTSLELEKRFEDKLSQIISNIPEYGNGKNIYFRFIKPSQVGLKRVIAHYAITSLFKPEQTDEICKLYSYIVKPIDWKVEIYGNTKLAVGTARVTSIVTSDTRQYYFAVLHFGGHDINCSFKSGFSMADYESIKREIFETYSSLSLTEVINALNKHFESGYFTLKELFLEERRKILGIVIKDVIDELEETYFRFYMQNRKLVEYLMDSSFNLPDSLSKTVEFALNRELINKLSEIHEVENMTKHFNEIEVIINDIRKRNININQDNVSENLKQFVEQTVHELVNKWDSQKLRTLNRVLEIVNQYSLRVDLWNTQNIVFSALKNAKSLDKDISKELRKFLPIIGISETVIENKLSN